MINTICNERANKCAITDTTHDKYRVHVETSTSVASTPYVAFGYTINAQLLGDEKVDLKSSPSRPFADI